ncbi:MAG: hypothetical protein JSV85_00855 [Candidatus Bathyarchaeota archaeon]|nr:MAG: hypothetical protein JSV85_00855 [Candidatus Bathyarchaeota archaeon]
MSSVSDEKTTPELDEIRHPNAEQVTSIATDFLERLGHKGLRPKKVSVDEEAYLVEVELKKKTAKIKIDVTTEEIKEYEIETKTEEPSAFPFSLKSILLTCGIVVLFLVVFLLLDVQSFLSGIF